LSLVLLISFFSFSFCFAFDINSIKENCLPKIVQYWNKFLAWVNNDVKPWLERNIGPGTRREFEKELTEAIRDVPVVVQEIWTNIKDLIK